jgi:hypothetical protein
MPRQPKSTAPPPSLARAADEAVLRDIKQEINRRLFIYIKQWRCVDPNEFAGSILNPMTDSEALAFVNAHYRELWEHPAILPEWLKRQYAEVQARLDTSDGDDTASDLPASLRRVGKIWHLRYHGEKADFPVDGNKFLGWLAKLLRKPDYAWTVAELLGDPEAKLKADASLSRERVTDAEGLKTIWKEIQDIDAMIEETGSTEALEDKKAELLKHVEQHSARRRMGSAVAKDYNNIGTQKRQFLKKLKAHMPQLAAHLEASIIPSGKDFTIAYRPPNGSPPWHVDIPTT